jgi:outer membrane protein assembly factor BamB
MLRRLLFITLGLCVVPLLQAAQPQFWKIEGAREFLDGDLEGLAVDSEGRLRLAPAARRLFDTEASSVWCLARDGKGVLFAGTGNDGKIFRIEGGKGSLLFDAPELEVHALAIGPDGKLYAGTSPDGKVYVIDAASGKADTFYDPADKYIWAIAFDRQGQLLVATGADGKIHRVDKEKKAQVILTSPETHILSLASDDRGYVYAGSSPGGVLYRIDTALKVFVVHDSAFREVKAIDTAPDGTLYAALIDGKEREEPTRPPTFALPPTTVTAGPEGFASESLTVAPTPTPTPPPRFSEPSRPGSVKGALVKIPASGEIETLWTSNDDMPHAVARTDDGVLVGTGNKGKLFRVRDDRTWAMIGVFAGEQMTALLPPAAGGPAALATSNPGLVHALDATPSARGTFTSKVRDTDTVSSWGRIRWDAGTPSGSEVQIQTRTGNTSTPDSTWSDWSSVYARRDGDTVTSERARFIQVRAVLVGKAAASPVLNSVHTAYLQRNLRPQVQSITVHPPGEIFQKPLSVSGEIEILGLEPGQSAEIRPGPQPPLRPSLPASTFGRRLFQRGIQTFTWRGDDANGDTLSYEVHYRAVADRNYRLLRKGLSDAVLAWDTSTVPNGRYVIRVTASDSPNNPESLALSGDKESAPFDVDNTPAVITATLAQTKPARVRAVVRDDFSLIRKTEYSVNGGRWQEVHPTDGINDALEESYEFTPEDLSGSTSSIVVVRATDLLGNVATARVEIPAIGK